MTASAGPPSPEGGSSAPSSRVPAAVVLYEPDPVLLDAQLTALEGQGRRFILFANGPLPARVEDRLARLASAVVLRSAHNLGLGGGLNAVAARALEEGFRHLFLLDQDSSPASELPEGLRHSLVTAEASGGPPVAALGPLLVPPPGAGYRALRYSWRDESRGEAIFVPTSGCLLSLAAYDKVGPFRHDYFIGGIDVEWGLRAWRLGYRSLVERDLAMEHRWGHADPRGRPQILRASPLRNYYYVRNALDILRSAGGPPGWRLAYAGRLAAQTALLLASRAGDRRQTRRAVALALRDGLRGRLGPAPEELAGLRSSG